MGQPSYLFMALLKAEGYLRLMMGSVRDTFSSLSFYLHKHMPQPRASKQINTE